MYHVAICEDDSVIREDLRRRCELIYTGFELPCNIALFSSAEELETAMRSRSEPFDLLLLDIQLPGKNGVELGAALRALDDKIGIIFITASAEYALAGYKAQPSDYLLKPVTDAALAAALKTELKRRGRYQTIVFSEHGRSFKLFASDILYIESYNHSAIVHTAKEAYTLSMSLSQAQTLLPPGMFARCHNSYYVNLTHIKSVSAKVVLLQNGAELPIGRAYRNDFSRLFIACFF